MEEQSDKDRAIALGDKEYFKKPFVFKGLNQIIEYHLLPANRLR